MLPDFHTEFPFAALLRATDRERLLMQIVASVWDNILELPIQAREGPSRTRRRHEASRG